MHVLGLHGEHLVGLFRVTADRLGACAWPLSVIPFFSSFALHGVYLAIERGLWPPRDHDIPYRKVDTKSRLKLSH